MFEKWSHVNTSVSWGGCGTVWAQTPRQAKETDSSFALSCRLAEQAGPHQNRRPLQIFIISLLLTSLLIFPWNKRSHKVLIIPLSFHAFKSLGRDQNLLISDIIRPKELVSDIPVQGPGTSALTQKLCPSSPIPNLAGMLTPLLGTGNCLLQLQPRRTEPREASGTHLVFITLCRALEHPTQIFLIIPITISPGSYYHSPHPEHLENYPGALVPWLVHS